MRSVANYFITRTKFIDDFVIECTRGAEKIKQIVIPGVGGDTRAHRLPLDADVKVFLLDFPEVQAYRSTVLGTSQPVCQVT